MDDYVIFFFSLTRAILGIDSWDMWRADMRFLQRARQLRKGW